MLFEANLASGSAASSGWYDLAVDETHVYWSDFREAGGIYRGPKLGGTSELLSAERFPTGVAVDRDAVYWVSQGTGPKKRSKSTGETIVLSMTPATGGLGSPNLQLDREFVYWLSSRGIERTPKAGGENTLFVARASSEGVNNISIQAGCLYFNAGRKLYRRPLTTGDEILIATSTRSLNLFWFSANEKGAFWADWSGFDDKGTVNARAVAP